MIISAIITNYYCFGHRIEPESLKTDYFSFPLPFPKHRNLTISYFKEVIDKIYAVTNTECDECSLYIATSQDVLFKSGEFKNLSRILDLLSVIDYNYIYVGETKGAINKVVLPFVINPSDFYRWFYLADNINEVENYFYNRLSYGVKRPSTKWEEGFEESLFREKLSYIYENGSKNYYSNNSTVILFGEGLNYAGDSVRVVLSFLDSITGEGFWKLFHDKDSCILSFKNVEMHQKDLAAKLLQSHKIVDLAGCLVVPGATKVEFKESPESTNLLVNLEKDSISVIPYEKSDQIDLRVTTKDNKTKFLKVQGGDLGLIVDNRERPLLQNQNAKQRFLLLEKWLKDLSSKVNLDKKINENTSS